MSARRQQTTTTDRRLVHCFLAVATGLAFAYPHLLCHSETEFGASTNVPTLVETRGKQHSISSELPSSTNGAGEGGLTGGAAISTATAGSLSTPIVQQDSRSATVMGMAKGYDLSTHRLFVGSLRKSGYKGHIILATEPKSELKPGVAEYFEKMNVTAKYVSVVNCSTPFMDEVQQKDSHQKEMATCIYPYADVKIRWGRFPFLKDQLQDCKTCTGPVLVSDVRDTFFQLDPFGTGAPPVEGLQVFEENRLMRTTNWLVDAPLSSCKGIKIDFPMLCSGTTIGTREAMLEYLDLMYQEMKDWMKKKNCCCHKMNGDDQTIHNYLYYTGKFPSGTKAFAPRAAGAIVNTVGHTGYRIRRQEKDTFQKFKDYTDAMVSSEPNAGSDEANGMWLGLHYDMTDKDGYFIDYDGTRSRVIHQYDRFEAPIRRWLNFMKGKLYD